MNIKTFFSNTTLKSLLDQKRVLWLASEGAYPLLAYSVVIKRLQELSSQSFAPLDCREYSFADIKLKLSTLFLGTQSIFWIKYSEDDAALFKQLSMYLKNYQGPHSVIMCTGNVAAPQSDTVYAIHFPEFISKADYVHLVQFFQKDSCPQRAELFAKAFFDRFGKMSFEQAFIVMRYMHFAGKTTVASVMQWMDSIIDPQQSLFTLSQYFFAKSPEQFFGKWSEIQADYSEIFWVNYWAEQVWRACYVITSLKQRNAAEAKNISYRLPFSLLQQDWKKNSEGELRNCHQFLVTLDSALKNSCSPIGLDLFYSKFFLGEFKATVVA